MTSPSEQWQGRLLIVLAAVLWSTSGFFAKAPWFDAWPADVRGSMLAFWRSTFAILVLVPLIRRPTWQWPMWPMMICFPLMVWSFMSAMVHGPAANAIWLQYLAPGWVLLGGVVLLKEQVTMADLQMLAFSLAGVLLILVMEMWNGSALYATVMGIVSGMAFSVVVMSMRHMRGADPAWLITVNHTATSCLLLPWVWSRTEQIPATSYVALGLFGVFQMSLPYVLFARGLRTTSSPEASVLSLIEPILVPVWVYIAWSAHPSYQPPEWWTWAGGGLILVGLLGRYAPPLWRSLRSAE
jgi:drug/metabolite transporter (DMT)-like permease